MDTSTGWGPAKVGISLSSLSHDVHPPQPEDLVLEALHNAEALLRSMHA
jgi:hypothetical protein